MVQLPCVRKYYEIISHQDVQLHRLTPAADCVTLTPTPSICNIISISLTLPSFESDFMYTIWENIGGCSGNPQNKQTSKLWIGFSLWTRDIIRLFPVLPKVPGPNCTIPLIKCGQFHFPFTLSIFRSCQITGWVIRSNLDFIFLKISIDFWYVVANVYDVMMAKY